MEGSKFPQAPSFLLLLLLLWRRNVGSSEVQQNKREEEEEEGRGSGEEEENQLRRTEAVVVVMHTNLARERNQKLWNKVKFGKPLLLVWAFCCPVDIFTAPTEMCLAK